MYEDCVVYGPYLHTDSNRNIVIIKFPDGTRKTTSSARYNMEIHLNRELLKTELVDHINFDSLDDRIDNLRIVTAFVNNSHRHEDHKEKLYFFTCPVCKKDTSIPYRQYKENQLMQGKAGPYCSKQCAGKIHH